jgi:hypothetical protein
MEGRVSFIQARVPRSDRRRKRKSARLLAAEAAHAEFLKSLGLNGAPLPPRLLVQEAYEASRGVPPRSDAIPGGPTGKRDLLLDHRWRRDAEEKPEIIAAIEEKARQVAPMWNKGAVQYITPGSDPKTIGRKV